MIYFRHDNGDILVICCEGNAGFYEIGIMATPLACGYSVLGWNYPGFGWSTVGFFLMSNFKYDKKHNFKTFLVIIIKKVLAQCVKEFFFDKVNL